LSKGSFDFTAGLYLEMPVKKRDRAEYDKSLFEKEQYILAVNNLKQLIRDEVLGTIIELRRARAQITATEATRLWQQETLRAEKEKLDVGISTIYLVSQAQRDLLEAQINEARAQINYQKFLIMHYKNEGTLLDLRGIKTDL
jgi:outer membrane protein TolC